MNAKIQCIIISLFTLLPTLSLASNDHGTGAPQAQAQSLWEVVSTWWLMVGNYLPF